MTALEVITGSKFYNIVVDTEQTAKLLLEKGGLRRRITIIPLNKIQANPISSRTQAAAAKLVRWVLPGQNQHCPSLATLTSFKRLWLSFSVERLSVMILKRPNRWLSHKDVNTKWVTLQGDVFEPRGLLTGGSRRNGGELLMQLHALAEAEGSLAEHVQALSKIEKEIEKLAPMQKKYAHLKSQLELKSYDLSLYETRAE